MNFKEIKLEQIVLQLLILISAFVFCFFIAIFNSPYHNDYGLDNTIYRLVSLGWSLGQIPYAEIFDHKGPLLYLINVIGHKISFEYGIWILEIINIYIFINILFKIGKLFNLNKIQNFLSICFSLATLAIFFDGGNMTEEWCLNFIALPLYFFINNYCNEKSTYIKYSRKYLFIIGLCLGLSFCIRANNIIAILPIPFTILIITIQKKQYDTILKIISYLFLGFIAPIIPFLIYFWIVDALNEMFFATIGFNFEYMVKWPRITDTHSSIISNIIKLIPIILLLPISIIWKLFNLKKKSASNLIIFIIISIILIVGMHIKSVGYGHYFIVMTPLCYLIPVLLILLIRKIKRTSIRSISYLVSFVGLCGIIILTNMTFFVCLKNGSYITPNNSYASLYPLEKMVIRNIASDKRKDIYTYGLDREISVFLKIKNIPKGKYLIMQNKYSLIDENIKKDIHDYQRTKCPTYILTPNKSNNIDNSTFKDFLSRYNIIDSTSINRPIYLYELKSK